MTNWFSSLSTRARALEDEYFLVTMTKDSVRDYLEQYLGQNTNSTVVATMATMAEDRAMMAEDRARARAMMAEDRAMMAEDRAASPSDDGGGPSDDGGGPSDDGGGGDKLGGVNFTSISLNYISVNTNSFDYVIRAQKTSDLNQIVTLEKGTELSFASFLIGLVLPESEFWVNLNPWEPDRIIGKDLGSTDVGRIMLEADLQMKRSFSSHENPGNGDVGAQFWDILDQKKVELMNGIIKKHSSEIEDVDDVQFSPVTRHWIVPDKVEAYENGDEIYIVSATLSINSEPVSEQSTYSLENSQTISESTKADLNEAAKEYGRYVKELQEKMILPLVVQEVNQGQNYSDLRQIYISLALAQWYRDNKSPQRSLL